MKLTILSIFLSLCFLSAACNNTQTKATPQIDKKVTVKPDVLSLDSFSDFPPEIDGCACYFSNDSTDFKNNKFIYANDFAQTSFLKINGVIIKFTQTDFKKINKETTKANYKSDSYQMSIEVKDGIQNDETTLKTGTIKLTNKNGKTVTKKFYGECGC